MKDTRVRPEGSKNATTTCVAKPVARVPGHVVTGYATWLEAELNSGQDGQKVHRNFLRASLTVRGCNNIC
jgi:hypothetical protein